MQSTIETFQLDQLVDGQLLNVNPSEIKDLFGGGNIRRTRKKFDELLASIKSEGIIQPVLVRKSVDGVGLELVAGYGRRDAAIQLGLLSVPALFRDVDDSTALLMHLKENTEREEISIAAEVTHAKRFISFFNGDRKSAALKLGWSVSKLSERLELVHATTEVLDALDDGLIAAGHALILSGFESKVQENTLKKLIAEKWTVSELRQRASKFQIPLAIAKFNQDDCHTCVHNTQRQSGLFGFGEQAECSKPACFAEKTKEFLEQAKAEAVERFGTVLWLSESLAADRSAVTPVVVGQGQFDTGCAGCEKRIAVIDDSPSVNAGTILESQCIDRTCLNECATSFANFKAKQATAQGEQDNAVAKSNDKPDVVTNKTVAAKKTSQSAPAVKAGVTSQVAVEAHKEELRALSGAHLTGNNQYMLALQVLATAQFVGYPMKDSQDKTIAKLMRMPESELNALLAKVASFSLIAAKSFGTNQMIASQFLCAAAVATDDGQSSIVASWTPTADLLGKYVTTGIAQLCVLSGFDVHFDTKHGAGSFKKLSSGKKADLIKGIMTEADFSWSHFAPPSFVELVNNGLKSQPAITPATVAA